MESITRRYFRYVLKRYRERQKMTQDILSKEIGVSTSFYGMMETGRKWPNIDMLFRIAAALRVPPAELVAALDAERKRANGKE